MSFRLDNDARRLLTSIFFFSSIAAVDKLIFAVFGVYLWELILHFDFEWSFITRRRSFRWPLVSVLPLGLVQPKYNVYNRVRLFINSLPLFLISLQYSFSSVVTACYFHLLDCESQPPLGYSSTDLRPKNNIYNCHNSSEVTLPRLILSLTNHRNSLD